MEQTKVLTARMHESGHYFFCPYCSLSFPHPPRAESLYMVGHGFCWYCVRYVPLEGGDKNGFAEVDENGEVFITLYDTEGGAERLTVSQCIRAWHARKKTGQSNREIAWHLLSYRHPWDTF